MRRLALLLAGFLSLALQAPVGAAEIKPGAAFELVRSLQDLQEQAARGNAAAPGAQAALMSHIAQRIAASGADLWRDRRNFRAVITFLLSGGSPQAIKVLPEQSTLSKQEEFLIKGAYAYAFGRGGDALALLSEVDPRALPTGLGAHVAFVRATLTAKDNLPSAIAMLDLARLLAPGTLVEEAALRREVFLIGPTGDFDKFIQLSRQYAERFPRSVYADNFLEGFVGSLMQLELGDDAGRFARIDAVVAPLAPAVKRELYLQVARSAMPKSRLATMRFAGEKAQALAAPGSLEAARARLYLAASLITTESYEKAVEHLDAIGAAPLAPHDAELRDAVTGIARRLRQWPPENPGSPPGGEPSGNLARSAATIALAQTSLVGAAELLKGKKP